MKTVYLDVYFLINFSVDLLSIYLSVRLLHIKSCIGRLLFISAVGSLCATLSVIVGSFLADIIVGILFLTVATVAVAARMSFIRRIRFLFSFLIIQITLGGAVFLCYGLLERIREKLLPDLQPEPESKRAILLALVILLFIGVFRLFMLLFTPGRRTDTVRIGIKISDIYFECEALVDTGNLVRDPISRCPVLFLKKAFAEKYIPPGLIDLTEIDRLEKSLQRRIRLIPMTVGGKTKVVTGIKTDYVIFLGNEEKVDLTVAFDKEEGSFDGYYALSPAIAAGDVVR